MVVVWNLFSKALPLKKVMYTNTAAQQWSCSVCDTRIEQTLPTASSEHMIPEGPIRAPLCLVKVIGVRMVM